MDSEPIALSVLALWTKSLEARWAAWDEARREAQQAQQLSK